MLKKAIVTALFVLPLSGGSSYAQNIADLMPKSATRSERSPGASPQTIRLAQNGTGSSQGGVELVHGDVAARAASKAMQAAGMTSNSINFGGMVQALDRENRLMLLQLADGDDALLRVADDVRNFDQLDVGDSVRVHYAQAARLSIGKSDVSESHAAAMQGSQASTGPGSRASGSSTEASANDAGSPQTVMVGRLLSIDYASGDITVETKNGHVIDMRMPRDVLAGANEGDPVFVTYSEAAAVSVEPAESSSASSAAGRVIV